MNVSYDARVDALYMKLIPGQHEVRTQAIDDDIALNFDKADRLVGIEVLDASKRLDLGVLFPVDVSKGSSRLRTPTLRARVAEEPIDWDQLIEPLLARKEAGVPVRTLERGAKNWVEEVGEDYVVMRRDKTGNTVKITRRALEGSLKSMLSVTRAILNLYLSR